MNIPPVKPLPGRPTAKQVNQSFDVVVIGGGINGSGIARDAAERGLKVLLVEKNDFGAGTTAYSTRLGHGGLRYLENFEIGLVRESLRERERLLASAPHLVEPLALGIPIYKGDKRGYWTIKAGMVLYDMLSWDKSLPRHKMLRREAFLKQFPGVASENLVGGAVYYDTQINLPERICVENALAAQNKGAVVLNHAKVNKIENTQSVKNANQEAATVTMTDLLTGETLVAKAAQVVNATGVWVDELIQKTEGGQSAKVTRKMGGTKGSHLIVRRFDGGPNDALYVEAKQDGRPFFIIPWQKEYYLIGTTDLPYKGDLDKVICDQDEVAYLTRETQRIFPKAKLDVLYTYSGVRPLPYADSKKAAGKITRKHIIFDHSQKEGIARFISIIGGKLTTYRNLAEETVDLLVKKLRKKVTPCATRTIPLPGGVGLGGNIRMYKSIHIPKTVEATGYAPQVIERLIDVYGSHYQKIVDLAKTNPALSALIAAGTDTMAAEVVYAVRNELVTSTADFLMRRSGLSLREGVGLNLAEPVATLIAQELGWTPEQIQQDVDAFRQIVLTLNAPVNSPWVQAAGQLSRTVDLPKTPTA
jgi:glycerol-3-phosphate dehydrogenase